MQPMLPPAYSITFFKMEEDGSEVALKTFGISDQMRSVYQGAPGVAIFTAKRTQNALPATGFHVYGADGALVFTYRE